MDHARQRGLAQGAAEGADRARYPHCRAGAACSAPEAHPGLGNAGPECTPRREAQSQAAAQEGVRRVRYHTVSSGIAMIYHAQGRVSRQVPHKLLHRSACTRPGHCSRGAARALPIGILYSGAVQQDAVLHRKGPVTDAGQHAIPQRIEKEDLAAFFARRQAAFMGRQSHQIPGGRDIQSACNGSVA